MSEFTDKETQALAPFFTNVDAPVFGLKLPQEVAGALFSRYSRTAKSLRRVFLDEFVGEQGLAGGLLGGGAADDGDALKKARAFYDRVLVGYGDDSVAQLGGAHLAVERVSNVAAQVLEDARIGIAFLEKSTRYVRFDQRDAAGDFLWFREPSLMSSRHRDAYAALMDRLFSAYAAQIEPMIAHIERVLPIESVAVRHPRTGEPLDFADVKRDEDLLKAARLTSAVVVAGLAGGGGTVGDLAVDDLPVRLAALPDLLEKRSLEYLSRRNLADQLGYRRFHAASLIGGHQDTLNEFRLALVALGRLDGARGAADRECQHLLDRRGHPVAGQHDLIISAGCLAVFLNRRHHPRRLQ